MRKLLVLALLGVPSLVEGQTKTYTNADLGKPITTDRRPTPAELEGLRKRQFVLPQNYPGPRVYETKGTPEGDRLYLPPSQPWFKPFSVTAFGGPVIGVQKVKR